MPDCCSVVVVAIVVVAVVVGFIPTALVVQAGIRGEWKELH